MTVQNRSPNVNWPLNHRDRLSVAADGLTPATITITLKDGSSLPIAGKVVSLAQNGASTITAVFATTDVNGQAVFTVTDTHVETVTYAVIVDGVAVLQTSVNFGP